MQKRKEYNVIPFSAQSASVYLEYLQKSSPLVHCITNDVVQNFTANILLSVGAIPAMVVAKEEVIEFTSISDALLINIGTLTAPLAENFLLAIESANNAHIPWVLDPVAVNPSLNYRTEFAKKLLTFKPTVIRGNSSEILTLNNENATAKGPNSLNNAISALNAAKNLANLYNTIVVVTGESDFITNGKTTYSIPLGTKKLTKVTGTGCSLSALVAAFIGSSNQHLEAATAACFIMSYAGKLASEEEGLGSFSVSLLDHLSLLNSQNLRETYHE